LFSYWLGWRGFEGTEQTDKPQAGDRRPGRRRRTEATGVESGVRRLGPSLPQLEVLCLQEWWHEIHRENSGVEGAWPPLPSMSREERRCHIKGDTGVTEPKGWEHHVW
jgi:hypothetical protein